MAVIANRRSVMTLFSKSTCIHSHRARLVLAEKNINIDIRYFLAIWINFQFLVNTNDNIIKFVF